jgi:uncharacterized cupredoxin-like copper-binding protein
VKSSLISAALCIALLGAACGSDSPAGHGAGAARTQNIDMTDNAYSPTTLKAAKGETVTFHFSNKGHAVHEAIIGDDATQDEHGMEMSSRSGAGGMSEMEHAGGHDGGPNALSLEPGKSGDLTYTFDKAGTIIIGCHEPGHYEGGMKITVTVS